MKLIISITMETGFALKKQPALPLRVYLCFDKLCFALKKKKEEEA